MKDNQFIHETVKRFGDGLSQALAEGSDTFSFEFDSHDLPGLQQAVEQQFENMVLTLMVLIRPKEVADPMLQAMQWAREQALAAVAAAASAGAVECSAAEQKKGGE